MILLIGYKCRPGLIGIKSKKTDFFTVVYDPNTINFVLWGFCYKDWKEPCLMFQLNNFHHGYSPSLCLDYLDSYHRIHVQREIKISERSQNSVSIRFEDQLCNTFNRTWFDQCWFCTYVQKICTYFVQMPSIQGGGLNSF